MAKTNIEWADKVWNPITGCNKVSAGCKNCYAEVMAKRLKAMGQPKYKNGFEVTLHPDVLNEPLTWKKGKMIFVNSMSDLFHDKVSFEFIDEVFHVMAHCQEHIFQVLTKRPERMLKYLKQFRFVFLQNTYPFKNVWLGVSVEDQKTADERIPLLLETPAAVKFLSIEPLLEEIKLDGVQMFMDMVRGRDTIDWVIVGAESGPNRRPCKIEWIENIVGQCKAVNIPIFVKQINLNGKVIKDINLFPEHLKIQQYPKI